MQVYIKSFSKKFAFIFTINGNMNLMQYFYLFGKNSTNIKTFKIV